MKLYIFRQSEEISLGNVTDICRNVANTLEISPTFVKHPVGKIDLSRLLEATTSFLDRGEPIVAVVLTTGTYKEDILGQGAMRSRAAWVKFFPNKIKTTLVLLHEIGHVCEADHCEKRSCLMYPYYIPQRIKNAGLEQLLCRPCYDTITESWIYRRLCSSEDAIKHEDELQQVNAIPVGAAGVYIDTHDSEEEPFPDWHLPKEDFVKEVKKFFGYE